MAERGGLVGAVVKHGQSKGTNNHGRQGWQKKKKVSGWVVRVLANDE